jgi:glucosamine--fructose-6-phosphate aminotransferase (isomerizing)
MWNHRLHRPKDVVPVLIDGLRRLEYRGYDSAGVAVVRNGSAPAAQRRQAVELEDVIGIDPIPGLRRRPHARWRPTAGRPRKMPTLTATAPKIASSITALPRTIRSEARATAPGSQVRHGDGHGNVAHLSSVKPRMTGSRTRPARAAAYADCSRS